MALKTDIHMILGRSQKRLQYLKHYLSGKALHQEMLPEIRALLQTYALLMSKLALAGSDREQAETYERLLDIDRKLITAFEAARLETSKELNTG